MRNVINLAIEIRDPRDLDQNEMDQCARLTLGEDGDMLNVLTRKAKAFPQCYEYYLCKQGAEIVGWAILTHRFSGEFEVDFFVREDVRGQGVGKKLISAIRRYVKAPIYGYPFDERGQRFFDKSGINVRTEWDGGDISQDMVDNK